MATLGLWNIIALIPRASPSGSGQLYSITPRWPWHNYYIIYTFTYLFLYLLAMLFVLVYEIYINILFSFINHHS